jgi:enoyl-CoA hydratase/carnithine racemase
MPMLQAERSGRVLVVRVDNPPHNFMDRAMVAELDALTRRLRKDRSVGSVVITGRPPELFVTHYDVAEILAGVEDVGVTPGPRVAGALLGLAAAIRRVPGLRDAAERTPLRGLLELHRLHDAFIRMNRLDKVVIAAINGPATGGGCELALACDLRYMADAPGIAIGLPEMTMGFNPGAGGTQRLSRILGPGPALEAMLEGRTFTPAEAVGAGIVHRAVEPGRLEAEAMETAERLARRSPGSVRSLKAAVYEGSSRGLLRGLAEERRRFMSVGGQEPARRAMTEFVAEVERRGGSPWADPEGIEPWQRGEVEDLGEDEA